ncbi:membrane protein [Bacteroidia bacterium]|nr:membrane protein [Bacteroidia bacterium]
MQVSLLTVMPRSKAVYTIYGHTALRLYDPAQSIDAVLNWGYFDSSKPNFLYHFFLGETDYFLNATSTQEFMFAYQWGNSTVVEQVIHIPDSLKTSLLQMLQTNLLPENVEYRYNIFFNNCTTRPRDIIEQFCGGTLIYPKQNEAVTIRKLVHGCTEHYPWIEFGIDLVIGNGADSLISQYNEMFLPERLMNLLDQSVVRTPDGTEHPMVLSEKTILQSEDDSIVKNGSWFTKPMAVSIFIFLIYLIITILACRKKHFCLLPFALLFLVAGLSGCLIAGLAFFSLHPCTSPNWNLVWLHPLHLIGFTGFLFKKYYGWFRWYHAVNFVLLSCFLLGWHWIPQALNTAFIPLIGCLWLVSGYQYLYLKGKNVKNKR